MMYPTRKHPRPRTRALLGLALSVVAGATLLSSAAPAAREGGRPYRPELFEDVARVLRRGFYDREFRSEALPRLEEEFRPLAQASGSAEEERAVVRSFLARIPASHLALYSRDTHAHLLAELACEAWPTLGFQLTRLGDDFFVDRVLAGGPADEWGLERGDRVIEVEGVAPGESWRLDWSSDDAALPDPALHGLLCEAGEGVELLVERAPGQRSRGVVVARDYSGCEAARASARVIEGPARLGYVHLPFVASPQAGDLVEDLIVGPFADSEGLLLDLRGRGGSASEVGRIARLLARDGVWARPVVLLTDRGTRSAKEVIAYRMQSDGDALVVGERTAGAVIPASFERVGRDGVLMYPRITLGSYTRALEGRGVEPDIEVEDRLAYSAGADPILEAGIVALEVWIDEERGR